jgi:hypothetical protein
MDTKTTENKPANIVNLSDEEMKKLYTGRYAPVQGEFHKSLKRIFGLSDIQAQRTATSLGSDLGRLDKIDSAESFKLRLGRLSKDLLTIRNVNTAIGVKNVPVTFSLRMFKMVASIEDLEKWGLNVIESDIQVLKSIQDEINNVKPFEQAKAS